MWYGFLVKYTKGEGCDTCEVVRYYSDSEHALDYGVDAVNLHCHKTWDDVVSVSITELGQ